MIKIWLDDVRPVPEGWVWYKTAEELIEFLKVTDWKKIEAISFDHDLGEEIQTGYDVLTFMEQELANNPTMHVPELKIHSANPVGRKNMEAAIASIHRIQQ